MPGLSYTNQAFNLISGIVIEIALDIHNRCTLIAGTGSQVAQRTDQVGQSSGCCTLRFHLTHQTAAILLTDFLLNRIFQRFTGQAGKIIICQVLQLQLIGRTFQSGGTGVYRQ